MARKRDSLLTAFPPGTITPSEASDALRQSGGDFEAAKRILEAALSLGSNDKGAAVAEERTRKTTTPTTANTNNHSTKDQLLRNEGEIAPATAHAAITNSHNTKDEHVRIPPRTCTIINNLSDRQYCCVWHVEVYEDGYRPDVARSLLARVARHVNPILRARGWRVKRLIESASPNWVGLCTGNGRNDADAASTNIQLNLRVEASKYCKTFRSFRQVLSVMLHEITHTSIGLEDIHPPAFFNLLDEIKAEYRQRLENGEVNLETDDYGCSSNVVTVSGHVKTVQEAATDVLGSDDRDLGQLGQGEECGVSKRRRHRRLEGGMKKRSGSGFVSNVPKRRPLLKGAKMIDQRTKVGKAIMAARRDLTSQELAARAALERFSANNTATSADVSQTAAVGRFDKENQITGDADDDEIEHGSIEESEDETIKPHVQGCLCRGCGWERIFMPTEPST